jgi:hypothetical protein
MTIRNVSAEPLGRSPAFSDGVVLGDIYLFTPNQPSSPFARN